MTVYGIEMNACDFTEMVKAITAEWDAMDAWDRDDFDDFDDFKDIKMHSYLYSEDQKQKAETFKSLRLFYCLAPEGFYLRFQRVKYQNDIITRPPYYLTPEAKYLPCGASVAVGPAEILKGHSI